MPRLKSQDRFILDLHLTFDRVLVEELAAVLAVRRHWLQPKRIIHNPYDYHTTNGVIEYANAVRY